MRCLMKRVHNGQCLRTDDLEGQWLSPPAVGERFVMFSTPLTPEANARTVSTSRLVEIQREDEKYLCTTETGSVYLITPLRSRNGPVKKGGPREPMEGYKK